MVFIVPAHVGSHMPLWLEMGRCGYAYPTTIENKTKNRISLYGKFIVAE